MGALADARDAVVDALRTAGVARVVDEPHAVSPPCVLVDVPTITPATAGSRRLDVPVRVIVNPGPNEVRQLLDLVDDVLAAVARGASGVPDPYPLPDGVNALPAYTVTVPAHTT